MLNPDEILRVVDVLHRDKGIDKNLIFDGIEQSLVHAVRRYFKLDEEADIEVVVDQETGDVGAWIGEDEVDTDILGRIAAQTAKQVLIQKIREAESDVIFSEFEHKVGSLVSGTVQRMEGPNIIVNLVNREGMIPRREQVRSEYYRPGERIRCIITSVEKRGSQVKIILSRGSPELVASLFELEVPEISERIIEIKGVVRDPGFRTKIAVQSHDMKVDPVGSCVGVGGSRIRSIVDELNGEKIDIIRFSDQTDILIANSLKPAEIEEINLDFEEQRAEVIVEDDQLSLAIGKRGQNVRLASELTGWELDITTWSQLSEKSRRGKQELMSVPDITDDQVDAIMMAGILNLEDVKRKGLDYLESVPGISEDYADAIMEHAYNYVPPEEESPLSAPVEDSTASADEAPAEETAVTSDNEAEADAAGGEVQEPLQSQGEG